MMRTALATVSFCLIVSMPVALADQVSATDPPLRIQVGTGTGGAGSGIGGGESNHAPPELDSRWITYDDGYTARYDLFHSRQLPKPPNGWPIVLFVHGLGEGKDNPGVRATAQQIAQAGYAVVSYDVRGQGRSAGLPGNDNKGWTFNGLREALDMAELLNHVAAQHAPIVNPQRIAVVGGSQGGAHAWIAAVASGRSLLSNGGPVQFPVIAAVEPSSNSPRWVEGTVRDGVAVSHLAGEILFGAQASATLDVNPVLCQAFQDQVLAQDYPGLVTVLRQYVPAIFDQWLANPPDPSAVPPILASVACLDMFIGANETVERVYDTSIPAPPSRRLNLTTGFHMTPENDRETQIFASERIQWLDCHLKGIPNSICAAAGGVPSGRRAIIPTHGDVDGDGTDNYFDPDYRWGEVISGNPLLTPKVTFFLKEDGFLDTNPLAQNQPLIGLTKEPHPHDPLGVPPRYLAYDTIDAYVHGTVVDGIPFPAFPRATVVTSFGVPRDFVDFDSAPLANAILIDGIATASLHVSSTENPASFQVYVAIYDVDPSSLEGDPTLAAGPRFIAGGLKAVRNIPSPPSAFPLPIELDVSTYTVPAGHKLRVRVSNVALRDPPLPDSLPDWALQVIPYFKEAGGFDGSFFLHRGPNNLSHVNIPIANP